MQKMLLYIMIPKIYMFDWLIDLSISMINTRNKGRTLDSPSIFISFSNTCNKGMNSSTKWIGLGRVANNQAVAK